MQGTCFILHFIQKIFFEYFLIARYVPALELGFKDIQTLPHGTYGLVGIERINKNNFNDECYVGKKVNRETETKGQGPFTWRGLDVFSGEVMFK